MATIEAQTQVHGTRPSAPVAVRRVTVDESAGWLAAGWRDMRRSPAISLGYGTIFVVVGHLLFFGLTAAGLGSLILPLAAGFLLVGPLAAVGLYEVSRRHENGQPVTLADALTAWRGRGDQIGLFGVALIVTMFVWIQVALILFALFFQGSPPDLATFATDLATFGNAPFLILGTIAGGVLAAVVFAISAVSLPMLLDRDVTAADAIGASLRAVRANWRVMSGWAATIALVVGLGLGTFFLGLVVALPLIGHASWHAYRSLIR